MYSVDLCLSERSQRFPLGYCSHVRPLPFFKAWAIFPKLSIHWGVQCRHLEQKQVCGGIRSHYSCNQYFSYHPRQVLQPSCELWRITYKLDFVLGVARVNDQFQLLWTT